jgi:hypothetical protein
VFDGRAWQPAELRVSTAAVAAAATVTRIESVRGELAVAGLACESVQDIEAVPQLKL